MPKSNCTHNVINVQATNLEPVLNIEVRCMHCEGLVPMSHVRSKKWERVGPTVWTVAATRRVRRG